MVIGKQNAGLDLDKWAIWYREESVRIVGKESGLMFSLTKTQK